MSEQQAIDALRPFAALSKIYPETKPGSTWLFNADEVDPVTGAPTGDVVNVTLQQARDAREVIRAYELREGEEETFPPLPDLLPQEQSKSLDDVASEAVYQALQVKLADRLGG